jgi:imidazole glycerol-phosphate synthase subunit HisH
VLAVIDYGGGNLGSLVSGLKRRGAEFVVSDDAETVARASAVILPGDGAFGATMHALRGRNLDAAVGTVLAAGKPFLGICVGMQLLYQNGDEFGMHKGFGAFEGTVSRFEDAPRVPHMGWNQLEVLSEHPFLEGVRTGDYVYFLHSYRAAVGSETVAACTYGDRFAAIAIRENVMGTQFHPEKSQHVGAKLLDNFLRIAAKHVTAA